MLALPTFPTYSCAPSPIHHSTALALSQCSSLPPHSSMGWGPGILLSLNVTSPEVRETFPNHMSIMLSFLTFVENVSYFIMYFLLFAYFIKNLLRETLTSTPKDLNLPKRKLKYAHHSAWPIAVTLLTTISPSLLFNALIWGKSPFTLTVI